ncbi:hypothetical protein MRX96_027601 [Rhipicephalus microplus]
MPFTFGRFTFTLRRGKYSMQRTLLNHQHRRGICPSSADTFFQLASVAPHHMNKFLPLDLHLFLHIAWTLEGMIGAFAVEVQQYGFGGTYEFAAISLILAVSL